MGKLKQPKSLETLSIERSAKFLYNIGLRLISECVVQIPHITIEKRENVEDDGEVEEEEEQDLRSVNRKTLEKLELVITILHDYFERCVPFYLYRQLQDEVMKDLSELIGKCKAGIEFKANMAKFHLQVSVAVRLAESLVSIKMRSIDFDQLPKMIRSAFYNHLPRMRGIEFLQLGSVTGGWKTFEMEGRLARSLTCMKNLTHLSLNYDCTDKILLALSHNCPHLLSLDITNSKNVTNSSTEIIEQLKGLKIIQLYRTSVGMDGYINLLLHLSELVDVGRYEDLGKCLEFIDEYHPTYQHFKLEHFSSNQPTTRQIQILCEKFPNIKSISLFHNILFLDLMAVVGINMLTKLKLRSCDFFSDRIRDLLQVKGCNITTLTLEHVDQIDLNALIYISQFCPELDTLVICNCNLLQSTSISFRYFQLPPFMSLKNLTLIGTCNIQHVEHILSNAHKLVFIHLGSQIPTNDELFEKIFLKNELAHLEELRILHSDDLTIKSAFAIVNNCASLKRLFELESWVQLYPFQLEQLKLHCNENNLDVDLTSYRKFVT
jgi:ribonucleases P/MRP protein subunit RPP40